MMKRLKMPLLYALVLLAIVGLYNAQAAWNIRQNGDGTTDFVPTPGSGFEADRIGRRVFTYTISNINSSATHYIPSPITGRLKRVTFSQDNVIGQAITASIYLDQTTVSNVFMLLAPTGRFLTSASTGAVTKIEHFFMRNVTTLPVTDPSNPEWVAYGASGFTTKALVKQFRPIVVRIDNGAGGTVVSTVVLEIDPE